jgi:hypothetical protein
MDCDEVHHMLLGGHPPKPPGFWEAWAPVFKVLVFTKVVL